jgi:MBG domain (YGX type)
VTLDENGQASFTISQPTAANSAHALTATYTNAAYNGSSTGGGSLTVNKATPTIIWANPADITYGTALSGTQLNATATFKGNPVPGTLTYRPAAGTVLNAGNSQNLHVAFTPDDAVNFNGATQDVPISVLKATLTVKADDKSKVYGAALPTFTASYTGLVNGDTAGSLSGTLAFSTPATAASPAGTYTITPSGQSSANYDITYQAGTLTVSRAALTIKADDKTKLLNAPLPTFTATYSGLVNGDTVGSLSGTLAFSTSATAPSPVGQYAITPSGVTSPNYTITFSPGTLSILYASAGICNGEGGHQILQPINADGTSVFKLGSTVPTKFRVCDANGISIGTAGVVTSYGLISQVTDTSLSVDESQYSTTPDTAFRWDSSAQQWIFNQSTKNNPTVNKTNTRYYFRIYLNDGTWIDFQYGLK